MKKSRHISKLCVRLGKYCRFAESKRYDEFIEIYKKGMLILWNYDTNDAVATIEQQSYSMAYCFLKSEKTISKEKGIEYNGSVVKTKI